MPDEKLKIADRIRKLLALSNSTNVNEAASAATRAQALMQEHRLTEIDVSEATSDGKAITELPLGAEGFMASWKFALATNVARAFFCEALGLRVGRRRKVRIIGRREDAEVAVTVFTFLVSEIERLALNVTQSDVEAAEAAEAADDDFWEGSFLGLFDRAVNPEEISRDLRAYRERWRQGAAQGASDKLRAETVKFAASSSNALVVVNTNKDEIDAHLKRRYGGAKQNIVDPICGGLGAAFESGYVAGAQIAVPGRESPKRLKQT